MIWSYGAQAKIPRVSEFDDDRQWNCEMEDVL